jgi:three-Cys-motif partner protein
VTAATPPFPEAALRAVLARAVAAWAESAAERPEPPADSAGDAPRRVYVDAFAGAEMQFGSGVLRTADEPVRAAAAVSALDAAVQSARPAPRAAAVLVEEDPEHLRRVYAELEEAAGGERLRATRDLASLAPGEVSLVEADFAAVAAEVFRFAADARALFLFAPPTARRLPWSVVLGALSLPGADVLVRIPASDWEKQARHTGPIADLPGFAQRIVAGCSAFLDDAKHAWLPAFRTAFSGDGFRAAMDGVAERYRALVEGAAAGRIVKPLALETADGAPCWLVLATADPALALAMNAAVRAADRAAGLTDRAAALAPPAEASPRNPGEAPAAAPGAGTASSATDRGGRGRISHRRSADAVSAEPAARADANQPERASAGRPAEVVGAPPTDPETGGAPQPTAASETYEVLDLFPEDLQQPEPAPPARPDAAAVGARVEARFAGRTVAWRDVLRAFAASDVTPDELRKALAHLKRTGRAAFRALKTDDAEITFPAEPAPPKPKPPRTRKPADGGLFGDGEG